MQHELTPEQRNAIEAVVESVEEGEEPHEESPSQPQNIVLQAVAGATQVRIPKFLMIDSTLETGNLVLWWPLPGVNYTRKGRRGLQRVGVQ